jgi:hypothetical protein
VLNAELGNPGDEPTSPFPFSPALFSIHHSDFGELGSTELAEVSRAAISISPPSLFGFVHLWPRIPSNPILGGD